MTLSPTALEAAAKAAFEADWERPWEAAASYERDHYCGVATAAITAYLAQMEKEGWVMVPRDLTPDMIVQGYEHVNRDLCEGRGNALNRLWDAMLAAVQNGEDRPAPPMGK